MRVKVAGDELVGGEDRLHRFHHRMAFEVERGEDALVAERAEHDPLDAGHVQRLQAELFDLGEQRLGDLGCRFGLEDNDHWDVP